jgi:hypothetical protein
VKTTGTHYQISEFASGGLVHSARSPRSLLDALGRVKVFQLLCAAHANEGDGPKILLPFTTLDVTYHIPKFHHDPITLIFGGDIWIP